MTCYRLFNTGYNVHPQSRVDRPVATGFNIWSCFMKPMVLCFAGLFVGASFSLHAQEPKPQTTVPNKLSAAEMTKLRTELPAAIRRTLDRLNPTVKARIEKALNAEPFPNQDKLLLGVWHGTAVEPGYKSYWMYERRADGTMRQNGIDLETEERQYSNLGFDVAWQAKGRVIFELKASEREEVDIFLIRSLDANTMKYTMVFTDEPEESWSDEVDRRGPTELPKPPVGWEEASE